MVWDQDKPLLMSTRDFTRCWSPWQSPRSADTSRKTASSSCTDAQSCQISLKYASPHGTSVCRLSWRSHLTCWTGWFLPLGFSSTLDLAPQIVPLRSCYSGWAKKKKKKREKRKERQRSTKDAQNCSYFCFLWKKKSQGFSVLLCTGLSWKQTKVKSVIFPQRKQRGSYIFPADPRMNHHSQAAVGDIAAQFSAQIYI